MPHRHLYTDTHTRALLCVCVWLKASHRTGDGKTTEIYVYTYTSVCISMSVWVWAFYNQNQLLTTYNKINLKIKYHLYIVWAIKMISSGTYNYNSFCHPCHPICAPLYFTYVLYIYSMRMYVSVCVQVLIIVFELIVPFYLGNDTFSSLDNELGNR